MFCDLDYYKLINLETNNRIENLLYNFYDKNYEITIELGGFFDVGTNDR